MVKSRTFKTHLSVIFSSEDLGSAMLEDRAGNSLIRSSLIHLFHSNQLSGCERFAQIAEDK